ncbi:polyhydroxybutyrate depolymerase [Streptomyces sp. BG9H]|uniref:Polyhydroxybutyrate depolymerase n=1 Tax=Streptomyces anatolicus TaxID=2675858 RepID=A0ABS6YWT3_9ACTN|nr:PHB depolymerase family esterase [Streptomyces anatolicus]MBW5425848.1 polyhydroxybutyrate depolymerase [Streptomyces anatolicus]
MPTRRATLPRSALCLAAAALLLPLTACGSGEDKGTANPKPTKKRSATESPRPGDQKVTVPWQGEKRVYTVHAPPGYARSEKLPLVIALHPYPADGETMAKISGLNAKADKENFLVAYPDGLNSGFNAFICCGTEDDIGFIRTLIKRLTGTWNADPARVYATGISNGGDMSYKLAVELPGTFAAIAPVSGGYLGTEAQKASYMPKTPVSVITFIGGLDEHYAGMDTGINAWQKRLSCKPSTPDKLRNNIRKTTAKCRDGSDVVVYRLPKMGHSWPGGAGGSMSDPGAGVNATDLMWEFFKSHTKKAP